MTNNRKVNRTLLLLSVPLIVLITLSSWIGFFSADFYSLETFNWQMQSLGQDMINLFLIVPILITTSFFACRNSRVAMLLRGGTLLYLIYTFFIFSFNIHFNKLFIIYCLILGLSVYSFLYFIYLQRRSLVTPPRQKKPVTKVIAIYFIVIAVLFYFLWISEIIPSIINNNVPNSLVEVGLFTNPVHVLDLSIFLPGVFIVGILLLRGSAIAYVLTPVVLTFFILMDLTIAALTFVMSQNGIQVNLMVAVVMVLLSILSLLLLVRNIEITGYKDIDVTSNAAMQKIS
jgi:hypothetical protein